MFKKETLLITLLILAASMLLVAGDAVKWINIHVDEAEEGTKVEIRVPMSLIHAAISSVKTKEFNDGKIKIDIDDTEIDIAAILKEIKASPDGEYVKVHDKDADVLITKKGGTIVIDVNEKGDEQAKVLVKLPVELLDAISVNENNEIDVKAMISALENVGSGDLVTVQSSDANVRIWID